MSIKKVLIIEDDDSIAEIEKDFLQISGFSADIASDGAAGLKKLSAEQYDLVILDLMLPHIDGYEIMRRIRAQIDIPIIMVTARSEEVDKIRGLGLGADDYIAKPFSPTELVARVKANIAQYDRLMKKAESAEKEMKVGNIILNPSTHRVYVGGNEIEVKNKEYELLFFFMLNPDIVFSKEQIYTKIWGMDAFGDLKTVAVHINRLREKIEIDSQNPKHLQTVWGAGYRFII